MSFQPELVDQFMEIFNRSKNDIAAFPGCKGLRLLRDVHHPHILFTYSYWESEENLNHYRDSDLFKTTWAGTRKLFNQKPIAWSVVTCDIVK